MHLKGPMIFELQFPCREWVQPVSSLRVRAGTEDFNKFSKVFVCSNTHIKDLRRAGLSSAYAGSGNIIIPNYFQRLLVFNHASGSCHATWNSLRILSLPLSDACRPSPWSDAHITRRALFEPFDKTCMMFYSSFLRS